MPLNEADTRAQLIEPKIAVVEAKAESHPPDTNLEQAKRYAHDLGMPFACATNGHGTVEYFGAVQAQRNWRDVGAGLSGICEMRIAFSLNKVTVWEVHRW